MAKKILAVDDDNTMLEFISCTLTQKGYDVTCITGGQEAIDILKEQVFDGMILDFYMPGKDAIDVIGSMYTRGDHTPTIVFSSKLSASHEAAVQGFAGITREVLKKPCTAEKLVEAVERVVNNG
ncbi:MAG: response regulator [Lachnospiraceae bacterium]|nr:response regulator [Lachnospiraceae bacterium]